MISILVVVLIFCLVCWVISILPVPASPFPIKTVLYIVAVVALIWYLLRYV